MAGARLMVTAVASLGLGCTPGSAGEAACSGIETSDLNPLVAGPLPAAEAAWGGRSWRVNAGSSWTERADHAIRTNPEGTTIRFELRDAESDRSIHDDAKVRRAELSGSLYGDPARLPNGVPLWGELAFRHHGWSDRAGMAERTGGVFGQIHIGSRFGGSPALAFRRTREGQLRITTRGQFDPDGSIRFEGPLSFDEWHRLAYRVVLDPVEGALAVWLDDRQIVDISQVSIGHANAESYWNFGLYFSGGVSGRVVADYAQHTYPSPAPLEERAHASGCAPD